MIKRIISICFISFYASITFATQQLSPSAYFSILTCAPGTDIHAHFGHTAIRLCDTSQNIDVVFNYGIFRYTDDFAYNFVKGETYYQLGVQQFSSFISEYYMDSRGVIEQQLALSKYQKQTLFTLLQTNYLPQNRKYLYNFFYNNCSSRPRDLLIQVLGDSLQWNKPTKTYADTLWIHAAESLLLSPKTPSWRTLIHAYVGSESWLRFGISLGLGIPADDTTELTQTMFLPDCLFLLAQSAYVLQQNSQVPLVSKTQVLVPHELDTTQTSAISYPASLLWIVCILFLIIAYIEFRLRTHWYILDSIIFLLFGLVGIFVWYVSFISIHPAVFPNIHVLWASPLHILFALAWFIAKIRRYTVYYLHVHTLVLVCFVIAAIVLPQYIHSGYIALIIIQLSRLPLIQRITKK